MRLAILTAAATLTASLAAQNNYYIPDPSASTGLACNVIPFGSTASGVSTWGNQRYQTKATVNDLGGLPGVITGLGFAPCGTGTIHFDMLEVIIDHHPAGAPLDPTFDNNLTPAAVTVLDVTDYTWHITANTWCEIGLQDLFVYNGTDDLVIQVRQLNGITTGGQGFRRDARQRLYNTGSNSAATGTLGNAALKWEVTELTARLSTYGTGCAGSNGTPAHTLSGSAQIGNTVGLDIANGPVNGLAAVVLGLYNGTPPFPLELSGIGMPNCYQFTDVVSVQFTQLDGAGAGTVPFPMPLSSGFAGQRVYSQFGCIDIGANATGVTTSNYGRILIGL